MTETFRVGGIVAKQRPRVSKNGHIYTPQKTQRYEQEVFFEYCSQCKEFFTGAVEVTIQANFQKPKKPTYEVPITKPDIDNVVKSILDGLNGCAWKDDSQVLKLTAEKRYTDDVSHVIVTIKECV